MKVAYFGSDMFMGCLDVFKHHGYQIEAIFLSSHTEGNIKIRQYAETNKIRIIAEKPGQDHIQALEDEGVNCFFSVEYDHLIPIPSPKIMTLNVHPTMLPEGRGMTPLSHLILKQSKYAGVTFHKLSDKFDEGDIVFQQPVVLDKDESYESLIVKLNFKIPSLLNEVISDLNQLYQNAKPQKDGSYWPKVTIQDRLLNWQDKVENINLMFRAFGRYGVVACVENEAWLVNHVETHKIEISAKAGTVLTNDRKICSIVVDDGIVIIYKDSVLERSSLDQMIKSN